MKKSLEASEWILSASIVLLLLSLFLISRFHDHRNASKIAQHSAPPVEKFLEITISGEVANPGMFLARQGTRLGDVVKKSRPKRFADLGSLDLDCPLESAMQLDVAPLKKITVRIEGAVREPLELSLQAGSRVCDLKSKIQCSDDTDLKFFKKRRLLRDKEVLVIPREVSIPSESDCLGP